MDLTAILKKGVADWLAAEEGRTFEGLALLSQIPEEKLKLFIDGKYLFESVPIEFFKTIFPLEKTLEILNSYYPNQVSRFHSVTDNKTFSNDNENSLETVEIVPYFYVITQGEVNKEVIFHLWGKAGLSIIRKLIEKQLLLQQGDKIYPGKKNTYTNGSRSFKHIQAILEEMKSGILEDNRSIYGMAKVSREDHLLLGKIFEKYHSEQQKILKKYSEKEEIEENGITVSFSQVFGTFPDLNHLNNSYDSDPRQFNNDGKLNTQGLAHDVRRPLSMVKSLMEMMKQAKNPEELMEIANQGSLDINQAMISVDEKIKDILSNEKEYEVKATSPSQLIFDTLREIFSYRDCEPQNFEFDFDHECAIQIEESKVKRVLTNIVVNALEAISGSETFWFRTKTVDGMCEITIGNSGSHIPEDVIPRLFDASYTSGKANGNGLGLAICKQFIEQHGGTISCRSDEIKGVEFNIYLPYSTRTDRRGQLMTMPQSSSELSRHAEIRFARQSNDDDELFYLKKLNLYADETLDIAIFDDDITYINALTAIFKKYPYLYKQLNISVYTEPEPDLDHKPDAFILDYDFGETSAMDGLSLGKALRDAGHQGLICMHSNLLNLTGAEMPSHVDMSTEKPMGSVACLKFLCEAHEAKKQRRAKAAMPTSFRKILLVEDDPIFHRRWAKVIGKERLIGIKTMAEAEALEHEVLNEIDLVIADYELGTQASGQDVAEFLCHERDITAPMYLYTNYDELPIAHPIVGILPKDIEKAWAILNS
ncbi:MAG: HAMP domain-containing histidine kinase [Pseudobacteriovorax sp.]|nr:HAMP domain-containing histidine kinase [Pseudobacteriovorax sp.]